MPATLELFYHAVAILSCRNVPGANHESTKTRNARHTASALQILSIMDDEVADNIVVFPWVPYAVSLSLSTAYRDFRHCKAAAHRARARKRLARVYNHLLPFGDVFWSAAFMAELAGKILGTDVEHAHQRNQPHSATQDELQAIPGASLEESIPFDTHQVLFDLGADWSLDDLDDILESNLDPSVPWYYQDMPNIFSAELQ